MGRNTGRNRGTVLLAGYHRLVPHMNSYQVLVHS